MTRAKKNGWSRRDFLQLSWTLGAGVALPAGLTGCGGYSGKGQFPEPQTLASENGILDVTLRLRYTYATLMGKSVLLRSMNASIPAPTLRVNTGDLLRIRVVNELPANPDSTEPARHLRYPNSTNLHTHGLHVTPGLVSPGVYGDFVVDDPDMGVQPGESRQHEFRIAPDHPAGAYWYHPHLHGSTAIQIGSGMAGALIISGEINKVPEIAAAAERIFVFQSPITNELGLLESFAQVADQPANERNFLINGVRQPRITMRRGEVQNWHFINAGIFNFLNLSLEKHALNLYSQDGNPRRTMRAISPDSPEGVVLAPGNRSSVLVQAGLPGTYYLRSLKFRMGGDLAVLPEDLLAVVEVSDDPKQMALPSGPLPVPPALAPITDQELAAAGGLKRNIVMRAVFNVPPEGAFAKPPITDPPSNAVVHPGDELDDWVFQTGLTPETSTTVANTVFALGTPGGASSPNPGMPVEFIPFQSRRALKQTVALGSVEEWTLFNMNAIRHPFHIHVNPVQVVKINGKPVEPYWVDTIGLPGEGTPENPTSVTFRTRFHDHKGLTVMHCHMLAHEDMGMMQAVDIV